MTSRPVTHSSGHSLRAPRLGSQALGIAEYGAPLVARRKLFCVALLAGAAVEGVLNGVGRCFR